MRAAFMIGFGEVDVLQVGELPDPVPGEGEVLVRVRAAGVNPVDWKIRRGYLNAAIPTRFPAVLGWDLAGVVEGRGHAARRFDLGEPVLAYARRPVIQNGTYAELIALPEAYLAPKPRRLDFDQAAGLPLAGLTAHQSLLAAELRAGDTVLVLGASGGVGSFVVQLAVAQGAAVVALASAANHEYLRGLGAATTLDYAQADWAGALRKALPDGVDVVIDCAGGAALRNARGAVRAGGRVVSITDRAAKMLFAGDVRFSYVFVEPHSRHLETLGALADEGRLAVEVSRVFPLAEVREAHRVSEQGHTRGKLVLSMG